MKASNDNKPPTINGHELTEEDLELLRQQLEAFDHIEVISEEVRELIAQRWPHLLSNWTRQRSSDRRSRPISIDTVAVDDRAERRDTTSDILPGAAGGRAGFSLPRGNDLVRGEDPHLASCRCRATYPCHSHPSMGRPRPTCRASLVPQRPSLSCAMTCCLSAD